MKILITGGAGYLGSMIATDLITKNYKVTVIDNLSYKKQPLKHLFFHKNFRFINEDVRNISKIKNILKSHDVIFPLAALVGAPLCDKFKKKAISTNEVAIKEMLKIVSKNQRIIFPNTNSGYGIASTRKLCNEKTPLLPISLYGVTKKNAEQMILNRENSISLRLATVFGIGYRNRRDLLVNFFIYNALKYKELSIFEPNFRRNFIHLRDISYTFDFCLENFDMLKNNIYNVGLSKANLTKLELCKKIKSHLKNVKIKIMKNAYDPDKRDYFVSNRKLEKKGWKPKVSLDQGITEVIKAYSNFSNLDHDRNY